jgi:hypothetical protein
MCCATLRIRGALDGAAIRESIRAVVARHESLRTTIGLVDGVPSQRVDGQRVDGVSSCDLEMIDLSNTRSALGEVERLVQEFAQRRVDVSVGPLFDSKLLRLANEEHLLLLAVDHFVCDAVSSAVLQEDIWTAYRQAAGGLPAALPPLPIQFADYAAWQHQTHDAWLSQHATYWRDHLAGAPRLQFPCEYDPQHRETASVAVLQLRFGQSLSRKLRELAQRERTLLPLLVLALYVAQVARWCGQDDIIVGFMSHGRHRRKELERMIGLLASCLTFRVRSSKSDRFSDLLRRVNREFCSAYQHQDFDRVRQLVPQCAPQLYFNWLPGSWAQQGNRERTIGDLLTLESIEVPPSPDRMTIEKPFLAALCSETAMAGIEIDLYYPPDLFDRNAIESFGRRLLQFADTQ